MELPKDQTGQSVGTNSGLNLSVNPVSQKSGKKWYLAVAAFLIVAVIGGGVFFFMKGSGTEDSESIPSLKKATAGLQGKISEQELFLKIKPKRLDKAKEEVKAMTDSDTKTKTTEFLAQRDKDPTYKSNWIAEYTFNQDNKGLYLFFPNRDMSFEEIRDSIISVDNLEEVDVMFANWNPDLGQKGQWEATEQNYFDKSNIKELVSEDDLQKTIVKKGQGVIIMSPGNIIIPSGHDSVLAADELYDWEKVKKGWVLINGYGGTLGETFKDCTNRISSIFVQDNAETADMGSAFSKVDITDFAKAQAVAFDKGFYAVWVYVNEQECDVGDVGVGEGQGKDDGQVNLDAEEIAKAAAKKAQKLTVSYNGVGTSYIVKLEFEKQVNDYNLYYDDQNAPDEGYVLISGDELSDIYFVPGCVVVGKGKGYCILGIGVGKYKFKVVPLDEDSVENLPDALESEVLTIGSGAPSESVNLNPQNVKIGTGAGNDYILLIWDKNPDAVNYEVWYAKTSDGDFSKVSTESTATPYASEPLYGAITDYPGLDLQIPDAGTFYTKIYKLATDSYQFKVIGLDGAGKYDFTGAEVVELQASKGTSINPTNLIVKTETYLYGKAAGSDSPFVMLNWTPNADAASHNVYYFKHDASTNSWPTTASKVPEFTEEDGNPYFKGDGNTYAYIHNLEPGFYTFKVVAVDEEGKEAPLLTKGSEMLTLSHEQIPSNELIVTDFIGEDDLYLLWNGDVSYSDYSVEVKKDTNSAFESISTQFKFFEESEILMVAVDLDNVPEKTFDLKLYGKNENDENDESDDEVVEIDTVTVERSGG